MSNQPKEKESKMSKIEFIKAANNVAKLYVAQSNGLETLADDMLKALGNAEANGVDINSVWASIAETNQWSDRDAGLDGNPMPKTLANYRSLSRKALSLGVSHVGKAFAAWRKEINAANKIAQASEAEKAPKIEAINLEEIELPSWVERATQARIAMSDDNLKAFDKAMHHAIESFMQKKAK